MTNQNDKKQQGSVDSVRNRKSTKDSSLNKDDIDNSEYICDLPSWDLVPPAAFVVRRVRKRKK